MSPRVHDWWEFLDGTIAWPRALQEAASTTVGPWQEQEGPKSVFTPQPRLTPHPGVAPCSCLHTGSIPALLQAWPEATEKQQQKQSYLLSPQNKLVHEDAAMAHTAHVVQCGQAQATGAGQAHCDSHWG